MAEKESKTINRWIIVAGAIMIQLALGAIYAWSAFTTPLQGTETAVSEFAFNKTQTHQSFQQVLQPLQFLQLLVEDFKRNIIQGKLHYSEVYFLALVTLQAALLEQVFP